MAQATTQTIRAKVNGAAAKMQAQAQALGINLPPLNTDSAPEVALNSSAAGFGDSMAAMGVTLPSWQKVAYGFVTALAVGVAAYFAAPVLASILVAGTMTVTANGFALWLASALGYLVTAYLTFKVARGVGIAASWIGKLAPAPVAA